MIALALRVSVPFLKTDDIAGWIVERRCLSPKEVPTSLFIDRDSLMNSTRFKATSVSFMGKKSAYGLGRYRYQGRIEVTNTPTDKQATCSGVLGQLITSKQTPL